MIRVHRAPPPAQHERRRHVERDRRAAPHGAERLAHLPAEAPRRRQPVGVDVLEGPELAAVLEQRPDAGDHAVLHRGRQARKGQPSWSQPSSPKGTKQTRIRRSAINGFDNSGAGAWSHRPLRVW